MNKYLLFTLLIAPAFIHGMNQDKAVVRQWNNFVLEIKAQLSQDKDYFTGIRTYRLKLPLRRVKDRCSKSTVKISNFGTYLRKEAQLKRVTRKEAPADKILNKNNSHKQTLTFTK